MGSPDWLNLAVPVSPVSEQWAEELIQAALELDAPLGISNQPALWGHALNGAGACLFAVGGEDAARAPGEREAFDTVQAHLLETLCSLTRPSLDAYFFRLTGPLGEAQCAGVLAALEYAKEEGHVRIAGIEARVDPSELIQAGEGRFEIALLPAGTSWPLAIPSVRALSSGEKPVGEGPFLRTVRSAEEVCGCMEAGR